MNQVSLPGYDNNFLFFTCPVAQVNQFSTCLSGKTKFLKLTIFIKMRNVFVKWTLKGRKCDNSSLPSLEKDFNFFVCLPFKKKLVTFTSVSVTTHIHTCTYTHTNFLTKLYKFATLLTARSMLERDQIQ